MIYNLHPLFVHFPIALLFVYSVIKIIPMKKIFPSIAWKDIERLLLLLGVLGAFAALWTGDTAEHLVHPNHKLVDTHSTIADIATYIYGGLLLGEITNIFNVYKNRIKSNWQWIFKITDLIEKIFCNRYFSIVLAILGFIAILLTGLLGGVIAYGLTADPIAPLVLKIFGIVL